MASAFLLGGCNSPPSHRTDASADQSGEADLTLRVGNVLADTAKEHTISTIGYDGSVFGPLTHLPEGVPVTVDLFDKTDTPELVHWHRQNNMP